MKRFVILALVCAWTFAPTGAQEVGWRTDGTGRYPQADPPTQWAKDKNIVWTAKMPARSNSTPVIVGERLFICAEPATLLCVSVKDGSILWQKSNTFADVMGKDYADKVARANVLRHEVPRLENELRQVHPAATQAATQPDQAKAAELKTKDEALTKALAAAREEFEPLKGYIPADTNDVNGYTSMTPATDGKCVCVVFGTGIAACYDLEGNRKWARFLEKGPGGWGMSTSPLVMDGKFIVQVTTLFGLDAQTGKELWKAKTSFHFGSLVRARMGDTPVVITPGGEIVQAKDGQVIAQGLAGLEFNAPIVDEGTVYYMQGDAKAYKLPAEAAAKLTLTPAWTAKIEGDRYYSSPLVHDGLVYAINQAAMMTVLDAKTGQIVYKQRVPFGGGTIYTSITSAGKYVYASSENGTTIVLEPGRQYKEVAKNSLETFRSCPVFVGKRMYIRAVDNLYCIGQ